MLTETLDEICIDIETINAQGLSKEQIMVVDRLCSGRKAVKEPSLSPISGQIICIGIGKGDEIIILAGTSEAEILRNFWDYVKDRVFNSRIVTFHGKSFDIPFIQLRSSNLHVSPDKGLPSIDCNIYYNNRHFDVLQVLSRRGSEPFLSLSDYCAMYGIAIDDTVKGCDIGPLWAAGKIEEIKRHCASDVRATLGLYHRLKNYV